MMQKFIENLKNVTEKLAEEQGLVLYEISFKRETAGMVLKISLDGDVTLPKCSVISRAVSDWIDAQPEDSVPYAGYHLEVSSLGIDRPLKDECDFKSQISKLCKIQTKLKDETGRRNYKGVIENVSASSVKIYSKEENKHFTIEFNNIKKANLEIDL